MITNKPIFLKFTKYLKDNFIGTQYESESHIDNIFRMLDKNLKVYIPYSIVAAGY
jgi:hypothetical protein